jgi:hypothetical protein
LQHDDDIKKEGAFRSITTEKEGNIPRREVEEAHRTYSKTIPSF